MVALSLEERQRMTRFIMNLLDQWKVKPADRVVLLALPEETKPRALRCYYDDTPLPDEPEVMKRVEHLLGIDEALRTTYPTNADMGLYWLNRKNHRFKHRTPLTAMVDDGVNGLIAVRSYLDCVYFWNLTGSNPSVS